jgi:hypothetical protein
MLYYPQLSTGAVAQYPLRRRAATRTVINLLSDGSAVKLADPDARADRWELRYSGLTDEERATLESFFRTADGPLQTFVFLDPEGNLLRWSEDPSRNVWHRDGMISVLTGADTDEVRINNQGQIDQGIEQIIPAPGWYQYCFSALVCSQGPARVRMSLANADGQLSSEWVCRSEWQRVWCSGSIAGETDEIRCRLDVEAGASVRIRAMQVQAQPMPGSYRRSSSQYGIHSARFAQDRIDFRADGVDDHSTTIQIVSRPGA